MQRNDQRGEFLLFYILQFIYQKHQGRFGALGSFASQFQQHLKIKFEIAIVGQPGLGIKVETDLNVGVLDLQGFGKPSQRPERALRQGPSTLDFGQLE